MVQGVGRHAMSSIVLLEGTGAYGPLLIAPVEGLGGPLYLRENPNVRGVEKEEKEKKDKKSVWRPSYRKGCG